MSPAPAGRRASAVLAAVVGSQLAGLLAGPIAPAAAEGASVPPDFSFVGAGWGHGVGMPQWGAYGMAKEGYDAASIVTHYYSGTSVAPVQDDMDIRVNLLYQVASARMRTEPWDPGGGAIEVQVGPTSTVGTGLDEFRFTVRGAQVGVEKVAGGQAVDLGAAASVVVRWAGTRSPGGAAGPASLLDVAGPGTSLDSSGHRYRFGTVEVVPVSTGRGVRLNVVNSVRIHDEYLYGISEVSSSWPEAAMQAQVLAARTYALSKVGSGVRQACSCHVDDGGGPYYDQTFTGWVKATAAKGQRWVAAVDATRASDNSGIAILSEGKPIRAFYFSSSGGATQSVQDVWGGTLPYAQSVPDPWSLTADNPNRSWTVTVPQARVAQVFGLPQVAAVQVSERVTSGAMKTVTATAPDGTVVTLPGPQVQAALGLKSRYVTWVAYAGAPEPPPPAPPVTPAAPAPPAPAATPAPAPEPEVRQRTVSLLTPTAVTVSRGSRYRVVGVVRPAKARLRAQHQRLEGGTWTTIARDRTNAKGRYRFVVPAADARTAGTYRVLVVRRGWVVGVSPEFTVGVAPR